MLKQISITLLVLLASATGSKAGRVAQVKNLSVEYRQNPLGVDVAQPQLSWNIGSQVRGERQSAYQILVASTPQLLGKNQGDLWNTGQVQSEQSLHVKYGGKQLRSAQQVFWKVRTWNGSGQRSVWSAPAQWTMGLLSAQDWQAKWIGATLSTGASGRRSIGYHAGETMQETDAKWVQVDLGKPQPIEAVRLHPMLHAGTAGFGFPVRFKVETANDADFQTSTLIADQSVTDFANPGTRPVTFDGKGNTARFVRVGVTKLARHPNGTNFAFALSQIEVLSGGRNVAVGAPVAAKDSVEYSGWGKAGLTDGTLNAADDDSRKYVTVLLRKELNVKRGLRRAVAFVCGLGHYEMTLNGAKVGNDLLAPGWTKYDKTCLYDTHDITAQLRPGANAIGLFLGNGMYNVPGGRYSKFTGSFGPLRAIAQIRLEYSDGTMQTIGTDSTWRAAPGPVTFSDVYGGEDYDARLEQRGWNQPGFNATNWIPALVSNGPGGELKGISVANPPIRAFEVLKPIGKRVLNSRSTVYDMGQNAAIIPRLRVKGPASSTVRIVPGELLQSNGSVDQKSSGGPSYWQYTLAGNDTETYFSPFFYRGCRYLQVELSAPNGTALPVVESIENVVVHAASPAVSTFATSNELFNRVHPLVRWAQRSNMVSVMTDCPHREKLGWLEENHLNGPALRYNFDMSAMFAKMMNDIVGSQLENGMIPSIAPKYPVFGGDFRDSPEWGSALLMVAWQQYEFHGDDTLLRNYYEPMKRYVAYLGSKAKDHIVSHGLSDWYDIGPGEPGYSKLTPRGLTATAFYYQDAVIVAKTARMLGLTDEAAKYEQLAGQIRSAFNARFFNATTHQYATGSQAANSIPLVMGIAEPAHRAAVLENIVKDVQEKGLTAGDVGYRYLLRALADGGRSDVIYAMNNQSEKPGYGLQLKRGATSLTEAWDANPSSSQNHFMLGQINEWFFHDLAGIQRDPGGPGFKKIIIKPAIVGDLAAAWASYHCDYGLITSSWKRQGGKLTLNVTIPPNTTATVYVPSRDAALVREGGKPAAQVPGIEYSGMENGAAVYKVGSGSYTFSS
ncbi:MAG TPA: family 78 glycoside hydrolase catalytic domain [Abditibacteriaceae bacterium]|jgi:hypothetical protein